MSSSAVRAAFSLAIMLVAGAGAALACGGEQAGGLPPGGPLVVSPAHPSPDPPPAVPLVITSLDAGDAATDAEAGL